jgi:hypothetical protein
VVLMMILSRVVLVSIPYEATLMMTRSWVTLMMILSRLVLVMTTSVVGQAMTMVTEDQTSIPAMESRPNPTARLNMSDCLESTQFNAVVVQQEKMDRVGFEPTTSANKFLNFSLFLM